MKTVVDNLTLERYSSKAFNLYLENKRFAIFDIETTGLSPKASEIILSGIMLNCGDSFQVSQFFANDTDDEKSIILKTFEILSNVDYVITYNGKHFDIPFLINRAEKLGIDIPSLPYNLDIYLIINSCSPLREVLPNLSQKNIEHYMGVSNTRDDLISGAESVELYKEYLKSHSIELEKDILLHNHDDLIQLYKILPILNSCDLHKAMYKQGFDVGNFRIKKIITNGKQLHIQGVQKAKAVDYISFPTFNCPYSLVMDKNSSTFKIDIPVSKESGAIYIDAITLLQNKTPEIKKYPSFVNGYLILCEKNQLNYAEINSFIIAFLSTI